MYEFIQEQFTILGKNHFEDKNFSVEITLLHKAWGMNVSMKITSLF